MLRQEVVKMSYFSVRSICYLWSKARLTVTEKERIALRQKIEESIESTLVEIKDLEELTKPISPENAIGRVSRMDAINNKTINEAALRKATERLKKLKFAVKRSHEDDFGICTRCKKPIPAGRLMLMPQSNRCVHCADH